MSVFDEVLAIAVENHGYVTVHDAVTAGLDGAALRKLAASGRLERTAQGVYRVPLIATGAQASYAEAIAWTGGRGVISHESALDLLQLCDVNPPLIHLTVPRDYAPRRRGGDLYRVWRRRLDPASITHHDGLPVVRPSDAVLDCLRYGTDSRLLMQACESAHREGYLTEDERSILVERVLAQRSTAEPSR